MRMSRVIQARTPCTKQVEVEAVEHEDRFEARHGEGYDLPSLQSQAINFLKM
jgi:hypothetical protein